MAVSTRPTPPRNGRRPTVLYADLDGTITGPGGSLFAAADGGTTLSAAQALCRLREARIQLVLMSGRTRRGIDEVARILGASAYLAELGGVLVELEGSGDGSVDEVVRNPAAPVGSAEEIVRSGAGALLLERFPRRLLPVAPWSEIGMMLQGHVEVAEANAALEEAGHAWLELLDNGRLRRRHDVLDIAETRAYHLVPRGVSKASGVRLHMQRHGIVAEQAAAVGDSGADLGVAADVGAFFLVANGLEAFAGAPPVHAIVTASARGEGFAEAVEALLASGR